MTALGILHLASALYLMGAICLAVSLNENRDPRRIVRETTRRWLKFTLLALILVVVVHLIS